MQRISNDIFPSTTHRVSKPEAAEAKAQPRVSFPVNVYLWEQQMLKVLPFLPDPKPSYSPVKAIEFHTRITEKYYGSGYAENGAGASAPSPRNKAGNALDKSAEDEDMGDIGEDEQEEERRRMGVGQ